MPRVHLDYRTSSKEAYGDFCKKHPNIKISFIEWKKHIYLFNENVKTYCLETGEKIKLFSGFGDIAVTKKKRKKIKEVGDISYPNLAIDWQKSKEKGKRIYNFNHHTEGYFFGWKWFKTKARIKHIKYWWFKPTRVTSRLIAHYIKIDPKYQHLYKEWHLASK